VAIRAFSGSFRPRDPPCYHTENRPSGTTAVRLFGLSFSHPRCGCLIFRVLVDRSSLPDWREVHGGKPWGNGPQNGFVLAGVTFDWGSKVQFLGVGVDAGILYQTMIRHPHVGLAELSLWLTWPEDRLYRALGELEQLNLVRPGWQGQDEAVLINPDMALHELLGEQEAALARYEQDVARSRDLVSSMLAEYDLAQTEQSMFPHQRVLGAEAVRNFADSLADSCTSEMMSFSPAGPAPRPQGDADRAEDLGLLGRGVRIRRLYLESILNDTAALGYARWLVEQGGEVRTVPSLPVRMSIYDRTVAIVAIDPQRSDDGIMVLRGTGVLTALCTFFDHDWEPATELGSPFNRDGEGLTAQDREVLRLLADGHTDAVVARKLGVSVRTTRRVIAELAERLGARSRFQIGVRAVEVGWLPGGGHG
jgi:DNA-binding CsgD family transcriptional regulator